MAEQMIDRITVAFANMSELILARELRHRAGKRGLNRLIKAILCDWLHDQPALPEHTKKP